MSVDGSPAVRALRTLELLQAHSGMTADDIAARLGVTSRAARRYVAILRDAGIPIDSTRGRYGGYQLGRGIRLPPLVFTASEALGLVMAVLDGQHNAADTEDPVGAALGKIIRALPENVSRQAASMRLHATAAPQRRTARPDPAITSTLVDALAVQRRARITYQSESGNQWEEDVDPWAVVVRHGRWYLLCHSHRVDGVRTYRIDRIRSVVQTTAGFALPGDLDPVYQLEHHLAAGWEFPTRVVFEGRFEELVHYIKPPMGRLEAAGPTRCVLTGSTSNPTMYAAEWLAAIPFDFRVEAGPELRSAVAAVAARLTSAAG